MRWASGLLLLLLLGAVGSGAAAEEFRLGPPAAPTPVSIGFMLLDINEINEKTETLEFESILTLSWRDPRQAFDPGEVGTAEKVYQGAYQFNEVFVGWFPQLTIVNGAAGSVIRI